MIVFVVTSVDCNYIFIPLIITLTTTTNHTSLFPSWGKFYIISPFLRYSNYKQSAYQYITFDGSIITLNSTNITNDRTYIWWFPYFLVILDDFIVILDNTKITYNLLSHSMIFLTHIRWLQYHILPYVCHIW